ncbi:MAG: metal ABC transporter solute-binding protein, Zn/Mn family [Anaerolineae bacterium]
MSGGELVKQHAVALALCLAVGTAAALGACAPATPAPAGGAVQVTVSIPPQKYFVERVGGEHVQVTVMVGPGADPHTYEPRPEQLRALSRSQVYFRIGLPFESAWMDKFTAANPRMRIVDTSQGIERMPSLAHHAHGAEGAEEAGDETLDPHIWLSPRLVKVQAQAIYGALADLDPAHQEEYRANLEAFLADLDALDQEIRGLLRDTPRRKFMVFHPAWGYFAREYGLEMVPIEVEGQEPSAAELADLIREAREEGITVVFAEPEFSTRSAEVIAREIGGRVVLVSPLAEDWLENLRRTAQALAEALR